jgi:hypothetical protein
MGTKICQLALHGPFTYMLKKKLISLTTGLGYKIYQYLILSIPEWRNVQVASVLFPLPFQIFRKSLLIERT